jgi:alpha-beta hydrolase superfamily lysophospholipase
VKVGVPRILAISLLHGVGLHFCDGLAVTRFALDPAAKAILTPAYTYALAMNFQPQRDYRANIRAAGQPMALLAGQDDEVFHSDRFAEVFQAEGKSVPVRLLPGIGHIGLTLDPAAVQAAVETVRILDGGAPK